MLFNFIVWHTKDSQLNITTWHFKNSAEGNWSGTLELNNFQKRCLITLTCVQYLLVMKVRTCKINFIFVKSKSHWHYCNYCHYYHDHYCLYHHVHYWYYYHYYYCWCYHYCFLFLLWYPISHICTLCVCVSKRSGPFFCY